MILSVCVRRLHLLCCRDSLTENQLTRNIWSRKASREKLCAHTHIYIHTTTCQEQNASNFSVICQPFNKTRALCPHTPPQSHKRQRKRREEKKDKDGEKTEILICLFPVCKRSTHLTSLLLQVVIFPSDSPSPPLPWSFLPQTVEEQSVYL